MASTVSASSVTWPSAIMTRIWRCVCECQSKPNESKVINEREKKKIKGECIIKNNIHLYELKERKN
jgi:hypothetical protein